MSFQIDKRKVEVNHLNLQMHTVFKNYILSFLILATLGVLPTGFAQSISNAADAAVPEAKIENQWYHKVIGTLDAWKVTQGVPEVKVLVCDSGIESKHPDLVGNIGIGKNLVNGSTNTEPLPNLNHGTRTAGLIAAHGHGDAGLFGVAPKVQIIPAVITSKIVQTKEGSIGVATEDTMAACVQYAIDNKIRIVNMSYFMLGSEKVMNKAHELHRAGGMLFVPAGNSREEMPYPKSDDIVAVSSTDPNDWFSMFSNKGPAVDMAAPGNAILTTELGGTYAVVRGTSNSAPLVAGAAALLLSMHPEAPIDDIIRILHASSKDLGDPGKDQAFGYGRLDIGKAVQLYSKELTGQE